MRPLAGDALVGADVCRNTSKSADDVSFANRFSSVSKNGIVASFVTLAPCTRLPAAPWPVTLDASGIGEGQPKVTPAGTFVVVVSSGPTTAIRGPSCGYGVQAKALPPDALGIPDHVILFLGLDSDGCHA